MVKLWKNEFPSSRILNFFNSNDLSICMILFLLLLILAAKWKNQMNTVKKFVFFDNIGHRLIRRMCWTTCHLIQRCPCILWITRNTKVGQVRSDVIGCHCVRIPWLWIFQGRNVGSRSWKRGGQSFLAGGHDLLLQIWHLSRRCSGRLPQKGLPPPEEYKKQF